MPNIFYYNDFRAYLKDYFEELFKANPLLSFRSVASKAGMSPNLIPMVIKGQRNLGSVSRSKIKDHLGLNQNQIIFFETLCLVNQSKNATDKKYHERILKDLRQVHSRIEIDGSNSNYLSTWLNPVLREHLCSQEHNDVNQLATRIIFPASLEEVEESILWLEKNGFIVSESGHFRRKEQLVTSKDRTGKKHIRDYHRMMISLAIEALECVPSKEREMRSITFPFSNSNLSLINDTTATIRTIIHNTIKNLNKKNRDVNNVMQINFQLFPYFKK